MKLKQLTIHLATAVAVSSTLLLSACGGGSSGDSGSNDNNKGQASASNHDGFINVKSRSNDFFPKCLSANGSEDPVYLSCLSGEYKGINPAGKSCLVKFNGDSKSVSYKLENEVYNIAGSQFDSLLYTKIMNNGALGVFLVFSKYKNDDELVFKYTQGSDLKAEVTYGEFKSSCIISEYKLNK